MDAQALQSGLCDHVFGSGADAVPNGNQGVGVGRHDSVANVAGYRPVLFLFRRIPGHSQFVIRCNLLPDPINAPGRAAHDTRRVDRLPQESIAQGRHDNCLACDRS